jgi:type IV pilus assembly protein PilY1
MKAPAIIRDFVFRRIFYIQRRKRGEGLMKKTIWTAVSFLAGAALLPGGAAAAFDACSQGNGVPPFLASGAKPNLLMVIDNSGSMLDSAYTETGSFCFDDSYITYVQGVTNYGGYFDNKEWYKWTEGPYPPWEASKAYAAGDRVYVNGIIWEATTTGTSTATAETRADDTSVGWTKVFSLPKWKSGTAYVKDDIIWSGPQLYKAANSGTSTDTNTANGLSIEESTGVTWEAVDSTWLNGKAYAADAIVSYKGVLYEAASGGTSNGTGVYDDTGVTWTRLNEGSFAVVSESAALSHCSNAAGSSADKYTHPDLCVSLDTTKTPDQVTAFAARGSFLNWAAASKFDVEKKILTGGKYNHYDDLIVGEHRGCSGSRMVKQVQLTGGKYLSLGVRGSFYSEAPAYEDRLDSTDDTGRLEVLAVTATGYAMSAECQAAITKIIDHGLNGAQNQIEDCVESFPDNGDNKMVDMRPTLNHSLQACWQDDPNTAKFEINQGHWQSLIDDCYSLYTGTRNGNVTPSRAYDPSELRPADGGPYLCYGLYDSGLDHQDRVGYMGRVWIAGGGGDVMKYCNPVYPDGECTGTPCYWKLKKSGNDYVKVSLGASDVDSETDPTLRFKNTADAVYQCTSVERYGTANPKVYTCLTWKQLGAWSDSSGSCDYPSDPVSIGANEDGGVWEVETWPDDMDTPAWPNNGILKAIADYCDALKVPETIDPSSTAGVTGETGNAPGLLRDSELMAFLGGKDPLNTMKGFISQTARPEGILHRNKSGLRMGAMSFNYVGAKTECEKTDVNTKLVKYCPLNNADGAELLTQIDTGDKFKADDSTYEGGKRLHVDDLAEAVNSIRATSWTPLAEAMYEAVGYYTQNDTFCLSKDASGTCLDYPVNKDPVQFWCQDNNILLITEGESTADINASVAAFASPDITDSDPHFLSESCPSGCVCTANGAAKQETDPTSCASLDGSAYLNNMTWWGQNGKALYKDRCLADSDGNKNEKQNISTYVVSTGSLTSTGTDQCSPQQLMEQTAADGGTTTYYEGKNPEELESSLQAVLNDILNRTSAGSAASVISSSRSGAGAVYQAVFWPMAEDEDGNKVSWVGDVHSLFVSSSGTMHEDTPPQNGKLDASDKRVIFYFSSAVNRTRGCYTSLVPVTVGSTTTYQCPDDATYTDDELCLGGDASSCVEIQDINYIWSANNRLRQLAYGASAPKFLQNRRLFTWNDANNDGMVNEDTDNMEWFDLTAMTGDDWDALNAKAASQTGAQKRGPVTSDFLASGDWEDFANLDVSKTDDPDKTDGHELDALNALIGWLSGADSAESNEAADDNNNGRLDKKLRSRMYKLNGDLKEWRLGDVIHSTPIAVSKPAEVYHYIYRDPTYSTFAAQYATRRTVIYYGGNDGMLHAVNGGFYFGDGNQFCCTNELNTDGSCKDSPADGCGTHPVWGATSNLGDELWSYIPYNLQPHLKCLPKQTYTHKYYVDQRPRIFDAQIFKADADHPGGWGTILVGAMRFGGAPVSASSLNSDTGDMREFTSAYFVLDITNPEKAPKLLGEITRTTEPDKYADMNYTTSSPAMIIMRYGETKGVASTKWYLAVGNGPAELDGTNTANTPAKLAVLPLDWLQGSPSNWTSGVPGSINTADRQAFRIPNQEPSSSSGQGGIFSVPTALKLDVNANPTTAADFTVLSGYLSDIISVDYNVDATPKANDTLGARYRTDAVYFGTVDGTDFADYQDSHPDYMSGVADQFHWNGRGRVYRLVTKGGAVDSSTGDFEEVASTPSDWATASGWDNSNKNNKGPLRMLADLNMPVIAAQSIGYDGDNYWIYAGTGRFFDEKDKTDDGWCLDASDTACASRSKISMFGIKEPLKDSRTAVSWKPGGIDLGNAACKNAVMTWETVDWDINENDNSDLRPNNPAGARGLMQTDKILVGYQTGYLACLNNANTSYQLCSSTSGLNPCDSSLCFPGPSASNRLGEIQETVTDSSDSTINVYTFDKLQKYIAGTGCTTLSSSGATTGIDGWYRDFHDPRERNLGAAALLGGLLTFTTYQPYNDKCRAEGESYLYGVHFQTGTAWTETVFGNFSGLDSKGHQIRSANGGLVMDRMSLGTGLATTPSLIGGGEDAEGEYASKAFIQTSTGEIIEIKQEKLPFGKAASGRLNWTDRCE